jgi:hypothetical protein
MFEADLTDTFIVTAISNTARYKRRYELYRQFEKMVKDSGVDMMTVELALSDRPHEITHSHSHNHLQLRSIEEFWHKENLLNLGIAHGRRVWPNKKRVFWIDADCAPVGRSAGEWFAETWHELQHYEFVQMWEWLQPLDYYFAPLGGANPSFMSNYIKFNTPYPKPHKGYPNQWGSPGLAWGANLSALDQISGIGDVAVAGAGDWYLAHMLISDLPFPEMTGYSKDYLDYWKHRQTLCERWIKRDVGFVRQLMTHYFHGEIIHRGYSWRENILINGKFSPFTDLKRDHHGLWQLETCEPRQIWIRDQLRRYFRTRNEDSIDSLNQRSNK